MIKILGHRGANQPENPKIPYQNTLEAFQYSIDEKADGVELDVFASKDGKCFVIHDDDISKHGDEIGLITQLHAKEISTKKVGKLAKFNIPSLLDVLKLFSNTNKTINIELKQEGIEELVVQEILDSRISLENILVSSFKHHDLVSLRNLDKKIKIGLLFGRESKQNPEFQRYIMDLSERLTPTAFCMEKTLSYISVLESTNEKYFWTIKKEDLENYVVEGLMMYENVNFITDYTKEVIEKLKR